MTGHKLLYQILQTSLILFLYLSFISSLVKKKGRSVNSFYFKKMGSRKFLSKLDSDKTLAVTDRSDHTGLENWEVIQYEQLYWAPS